MIFSETNGLEVFLACPPSGKNILRRGLVLTSAVNYYVCGFYYACGYCFGLMLCDRIVLKNWKMNHILHSLATTDYYNDNLQFQRFCIIPTSFYSSFWIKIGQDFLCLFLRGNTMLNCTKSLVGWIYPNRFFPNSAIFCHWSIKSSRVLLLRPLLLKLYLLLFPS